MSRLRLSVRIDPPAFLKAADAGGEGRPKLLGRPDLPLPSLSSATKRARGPEPSHADAAPQKFGCVFCAQRSSP